MPVAELKKLDVFVGKWRTSETMNPGEFAPAGGKGEGTAELTWRLEGRFVHSAYASRGTTGAFEGTALMTYDTDKKVYRSWWFDSRGTGEEYRGNWDGEKLVMEGVSKARGAGIRSRILYSDIKPDSYRFTYENSKPGAPLKKEFEIVYTRAK